MYFRLCYKKTNGTNTFWVHWLRGKKPICVEVTGLRGKKPTKVFKKVERVNKMKLIYFEDGKPKGNNPNIFG